MIERHAFGTLRDIGRELDALGITVRDQFGKTRKASDFTDTLIRYIEIQEAKVSRSETDMRVREAIESVWVPLFVVPWVVGACAIVAIVGNTLYRLFLLVL